MIVINVKAYLFECNHLPHVGTKLISNYDASFSARLVKHWPGCDFVWPHNMDKLHVATFSNKFCWNLIWCLAECGMCLVESVWRTYRVWRYCRLQWCCYFPELYFVICTRTCRVRNIASYSYNFNLVFSVLCMFRLCWDGS